MTSFSKKIHSEFWFPQQIIICQDLEYKKLKNKFVDYCKKKQKEDPNGRNYSNSLGWQSNDISSEEIANSWVCEYLKENVEQSLHTQFNMKDGTNFSIDNFWINISHKYASNDYHIHNNCDYSGCLYIQSDSNSGAIKLNPNINNNTDWMNFLKDEYKNMYHIHPSVEFNPQEGVILLFPSYLMHKVNNNFSNKERISIAFNIKFFKNS
jgi:uncharacterized protein (TIGR02466 family)